MWSKGRSCKLIVMLAMTFSMFLAELSAGFITNSTSLIADSFHMLSDVLSLIIAIVSIYMASKPTINNTYGWVRAEILGALVNAVFLVALCLSILIEGIKRLCFPEPINRPVLLLVVGAIGLVVNLVGLILFHEHGHSSPDPTSTNRTSERHVRGGTLSSLKYYDTEEYRKNKSSDYYEAEYDVASDCDDQLLETKDKFCVAPKDKVLAKNGAATASESKSGKHGCERKHEGHLNMRAVFLHVLGDALGSIVVIASAVIVILIGNTEWTPYVDPSLSVVMVCIILCTTIPLLKETALILLQTVPTHMDISAVKAQLLADVPGVLGVHEFHVWQLAGHRIIATAHVRCRDFQNYMTVAQEIKDYFHTQGIHSTTIQPECNIMVVKEGPSCLIKCNGVDDCHDKRCCIESYTIEKK